MATNVFEVFATLGFNGDQFFSGLNSAEQRLQGLERSFTGAGRTLTAGLTVPIVGAATGALTAASTYESAFAGVRKTVDATEEEFAALSEGIRSMSLEMPANAASIAAVAEAAGQLGISNENILTFTETMIGLGEATNMTAETAATSLARFANIVQMPQENFDRLGSSIVQLGNNLATTEGEITEMALRIAGAGAQVGLTEAEILGVAGALSSVGISAEAGGTSISRVMLTMMTDVMNGGEGLQNFADVAGVTSEEFAESFRNRPAEAITSFVDGLSRISGEGGNVVAALDELGLGEIRVRDALLRMSGAGDVLVNSLALSAEAWGENAALQEEVQQRYQTTESQLAMLRNAFMDVAISLGEALLPFLHALIEAAGPLVERIKSVVDWFSNLDQGQQQTIVTVAALVAALGPLLMIVGSVAGAIGALVPVFGLLLSPIGLVIAAVAALVAVFATDFLGIRTFVVEAWNGVIEAFQNAWDWIVRFFTGTPADMLQMGKDLVQGLIDGILGMIGSVGEAVSNVASNVMNTFKGWLGIESPSKVFHRYGLDIGEGLAQGMEASEGRVASAAQRLADVAVNAFQLSASGAFTADNIVGGVTAGLEGADAMRAIQERLDVLRDARNVSFARSRIGAWGAVSGVLDREMNALKEELQRLSATLRATTQQQTRSTEVQTARFSRAVDQFDSGVRGMTLAGQRQ